MTINFDDYKTPIFPGINDTPIPPTTTKAGNGSDLIARVNGLIDELANLPTGNDTSINWTAKLPPESSYLKLEIYYTNALDTAMEQYINTSQSLALSQYELIATYTMGTDIEPNETINISELIQQYGVGYYFFVFRDSPAVLKSYTYAFASNASVRGATALPKGLIYLYATNDQYNSSTNVLVSPLIVKQIASQAEITLLYTQPEIG